MKFTEIVEKYCFVKNDLTHLCQKTPYGGIDAICGLAAIVMFFAVCYSIVSHFTTGAVISGGALVSIPLIGLCCLRIYKSHKKTKKMFEGIKNLLGVHAKERFLKMNENSNLSNTQMDSYKKEFVWSKIAAIKSMSFGTLLAENSDFKSALQMLEDLADQPVPMIWWDGLEQEILLKMNEIGLALDGIQNVSQNNVVVSSVQEYLEMTEPKVKVPVVAMNQ